MAATDTTQRTDMVLSAGSEDIVPSADFHEVNDMSLEILYRAEIAVADDIGMMALGRFHGNRRRELLEYLLREIGRVARGGASASALLVLRAIHPATDFTQPDTW